MCLAEALASPARQCSWLQTLPMLDVDVLRWATQINEPTISPVLMIVARNNLDHRPLIMLVKSIHSWMTWCVCVKRLSTTTNVREMSYTKTQWLWQCKNAENKAFIPRHSRVELGALTHHSALSALLTSKHVSKQLLPQPVVAGWPWTDASSYHILLFHSVSVGTHVETGLMQHWKPLNLLIVRWMTV